MFFKAKTFSRWARKIISDDAFCHVAREIQSSVFKVDLGGRLCKKRVGLLGKGKSGSWRTLFAQKHKDAIFFLAGREKSQPSADFSDQEVETAKVISAGLQAANATTLAQLLATEILKDVCTVSE